MSNILINIVIGLSAAVIGVLAFANELSKFKYLKFLDSIKYKIIIFFITTIVGISATIKKDLNSENQLNNEKKIAKNEQLKKDSINRSDTEKSNRGLLKTFTETLIQYGLKYDSTEKKIAKIVKDSLNQVTNNNYGTNPTLSISPNEGIKYLNNINGDNFRFHFSNESATSKNINISIYCCVIKIVDYTNFKKDLKFLFRDDQFKVNYQMIKDQISTIHINTGFVADSTSNYYFLVKGSYSNSDNSKIFYLDQLYVFNFEKKKYGGTTEPINSVIRKILADRGIIQ